MSRSILTRSLPASFSAGNHHGFRAQFKALPALSAVIMAVAVASRPFPRSSALCSHGQGQRAPPHRHLNWMPLPKLTVRRPAEFNCEHGNENANHFQ